MNNTATNLMLKRLLNRRKSLQKVLDDLLEKPASYNLSGSVSVTSQSPEKVREELARLDSAIAALANDGNGTLTRVYPDYSHPTC
jgi:hypothetical protein